METAIEQHDHRRPATWKDLTLIIFCMSIIVILTMVFVYYGPPGLYKPITNYTYENNTLYYKLENNVYEYNYELKLPKETHFTKDDKLEFTHSLSLFSDKSVTEFWVNGKRIYGPDDNVELFMKTNQKDGKKSIELYFKNKW